MPDRQNWWHQKFCTKPECRKASKVESHRRWLNKPENRDLFRGWAQVERVRQWRAKNPGYWKRAAKPPVALQDLVPVQVVESKEVAEKTSPPPLQDFVSSQDPLLLGLISHLIDSPLQENVEQAALRLLQKGRSILDMRFGMKTKGHTYADQKASLVRGTAPDGSGTVQLGGSSAGPPAPSPRM